MYPVMSNPSHYLEKENFLGSHGKRKRKKKMHIRQPVEFFASPVYPSTPTSVQMGLGATESAGNRSWDNTALPSGVEWGQPGELWVSKAGVVQFCNTQGPGGPAGPQRRCGSCSCKLCSILGGGRGGRTAFAQINSLLQVGKLRPKEFAQLSN